MATVSGKSFSLLLVPVILLSTTNSGVIITELLALTGGATKVVFFFISLIIGLRAGVDGTFFSGILTISFIRPQYPTASAWGCSVTQHLLFRMLESSHEA